MTQGQSNMQAETVEATCELCQTAIMVGETYYSFSAHSFGGWDGEILSCSDCAPRAWVKALEEKTDYWAHVQGSGLRTPEDVFRAIDFLDGLTA
jgi:hypothetical protein